MKGPAYSLMLVDDHPIIHEALDMLLLTNEQLVINARATSSEEAMLLLKSVVPDLVILDLSMGDSDGTYLIQKIHSRYPQLRLLVYTMSEEKLYGERAAEAGARGFVMKTSPSAILLKAIYTVLNDQLYFSEEILERLNARDSGRPVAPLSSLDYLSNREMDIFRLIGEGYNTYEISEKLTISKNTVDTHRINIRNKLELPSGKALDRMAYEVVMKGQLPER